MSNIPTFLDVNSLSIDLENYRTVPQNNEKSAIEAIVSVKPDRFFAVLESLIDDGYLPTENIIVLDDGANKIVKEGNRRVAALKIIHGHYKLDDLSFAIPSVIPPEKSDT
jgi:hypothetical protein